MMKSTLILASLCVALVTSAVSAEELSVMDADNAQAYGHALSEKFGNADGHQVKIEPVATKATGLVLGNEGIIIVPTKQVVDGEENPAVESETGAPLAYLFMSPRFNPLNSGEKVEEKKLRSVKYGDPGDENHATSLILAVRRVEGDDWRLYVYGSDKKPLIDAKFFPGEEEKTENLSIHVQDVKDGKGTLVVTVLKKYEASFEISQ